MIFYLGDIVEVISDKGYVEQYSGCVGRIVELGYDTVGGTREDPEISVVFEDGYIDMFWKEELELFSGKELITSYE